MSEFERIVLIVTVFLPFMLFLIANMTIFGNEVYYVHYKDGNKSVCMRRNVARDYASIFGGTVHRHKKAKFWQW